MVSNVGRNLEDFTIPTSQRGVSEDLGQEDFLKLMVEQMRNQNPLDPQDNGEFFSQIAQFQTLDVMNTISSAITALVEISGLSNASSLIGRSIVADVPQSPDPVTGIPRPPQLVGGIVERVTFDSAGAVLHVGPLAIPAALVSEISDPVAETQTVGDITAELLAQLEALGVLGLDDPEASTTETEGEADPVASTDAAGDEASDNAASDSGVADQATGDQPAASEAG